MEEEESQIQLHKVFVDLSLENDLKEEELKWFKSRIAVEKIKDKKKDETRDSEHRKTRIVSDWETRLEKPGKFYLKLTETETIWLVSLDPSLSENSVEDGERVRRENETYKMKKTKKELVRKRCMADSQTPRHIEKSKGTLTSEIRMVNADVFASEWDLHDTYNALDKCVSGPSNKYLVCVKASDNAILSPEGVFASFGFKHASLVVERLLASNCYQPEQSVFKKELISRYYDGPTSFSYKVEPLWDFKKDLKRGLMVTDMDWNPLNEDLLAVAYGDLTFKKGSPGLICVWSPKNPRQPEREFEFSDSVTSLHFSRTRPNILGVGTRGGNVYVLDVSDESGNIRMLGSESWKTHPGPVWKVEWFLYKELIFEREELLAVGESGLLMLFSMTLDKDTTEILKLNYVISMRKVYEKSFLKKITHRMSIPDEIFDKKTFSGLAFSLFSDREFCYISTKEGVLVKCNLRNPSMTDGIFLGHEGPVYTVQHSPVTDLVYFTCGADWSVKIWMEGISQPLIILQHKTPVACARWSPTIPTMIASIGEKELSLWDIAWNVLAPMSVRNFEETKKPLSTLLFTSNGMNIVVGDQDGLVHMLHLSELPRIPFLQREALIGAIRRALLRNEHHLLGKFSRLVEANKEKLKTEIKVQHRTNNR